MTTQSIFRVSKDKDNPYVMINKEFLNNDNLTWKAKGLLTYLLSLPDDWIIYESEVVKHSKDSRDSFRTAIKELLQEGYVIRDRVRDSKGHLQGSTYCVYEVPTKDGLSNIGKSNIGESPTTNNNYTNNDITNIPRKKQIKRKPTKNNKSEYSDYALKEMIQLGQVINNM